MSFLSRLERKLGRFALPHVTIGLIACQVLTYAGIFAQTSEQGQSTLQQQLLLLPNLVFAGEVWRLVTFLALPPLSNPFFAFFFWYLFYLMGTALEYQWGEFRYNVYLLIGYFATVAVSFLTPDLPSTNAYLQGSVFLAFAFLFPNFEMQLFFLLPVKIKWLAMLTWISYFLTVVFGSWLDRLLVLASVGNFFVFFGKDVVYRIQTGQRRMSTQVARLAVKERPYTHRCTICGITDRTHPTMDFRYCSKCIGAHGYCSDHLRNHEHLTQADAPSAQ